MSSLIPVGIIELVVWVRVSMFRHVWKSYDRPPTRDLGDKEWQEGLVQGAAKKRGLPCA
jgi:hypothetical protein